MWIFLHEEKCPGGKVFRTAKKSAGAASKNFHEGRQFPPPSHASARRS